ncbi:MAG: twin-arginine translocase subunit TatC [Deltaproteobacteria bacterium]|nr:twin-arginine translocase subunit TatC [Deltaproteobacteria bacterium]
MTSENDDRIEPTDEARMSFLDHLSELRSRLMRAMIAIALGFALCMVFSERLFKLLAAPIIRYLPDGASLVFTALQSPFFIYIKVGFIAGLFLALPYVLYEIWLFVKPGLYEREKKLAAPFIVLATGLFYAGAAFCYFIVFPAAFQFFLSFESPELKPMIDIKEYVSLFTMLLLAFGVIFETPIIVVLIGLLGLVDSNQLRKGRRYSIVIAFIVGAVLTPTPDPLNQTLMAVPIMILYEVGLRILGSFEKKRKAEAEDEATQQTSP